MEYSDFDIEDFLADESFQQYCLGRNQKNTLFWTNWLKMHPEKQSAANKAREMYFLLNGSLTSKAYRRHYDLFADKLLKHTLQRRDGIIVPISKQPFNWKSLLTAAAAIVIAFSIGLMCYYHLSTGKTQDQNMVVYRSGAGEKKTLTLPDGTIVILNNESQITYSKNYNSSDRKINLTGEAYFRVVHNKNKPFTVHTTKLDIKDIGTVFNVKAYPNDKYTEASLIEGEIELKVANINDAPSIILHPKQKMLVINDQQKPVLTANIPIKTIPRKDYEITAITANPAVKTIVETDWVKNRLTFNDEEFDDIAKRIERWYNVKIIFENNAVRHYRFVATFNDQTLIEVLKVLKLSNEFQYRKEGDSIIIY